MRVLITGGNGQLGSQFRYESGKFSDVNFTFVDVEDIDLLDEKMVDQYFEENRFDAIVNCAAFTDVDGAEDREEQANALNVRLVENLAIRAKKQKALLVHISTDYVFSGKSYLPYMESDTPDPASAYGRSKLKGEEALKNIGGNTAIIRTSWLVSSFGRNFIKTIFRLSAERQELKVVFDQVGNPTYAGDLVRAVVILIKKQKDLEGVRIYHFSNEGVCSWYDLAHALVEMSGNKCRIVPVRSGEYPQKAPRPPFSTLDKAKIKNDLELEIPHWRDSLTKIINSLKNQ
jgi:dTDP-4-dehydrorhamnose reductase